MFNNIFKRFTTPNTVPAPSPSANNNYTVTVPASSTIQLNNVGMAAGALAGVTTYGTGVGISTIGQFSSPKPANIISFYTPAGQEIVKMNLDGSITWASGIDVDAAAEAFGVALHIGAEQRAGISKSVKLKMRDSIFEDLIQIAKDKGSLTAEDLTYMLQASKIVEKLKGGE